MAQNADDARLSKDADANTDPQQVPPAEEQEESTGLAAQRIHTNDIWHSLLLSDTTRSTAPQHLEALFRHCDRNKLTKAEIVFQLMYLVGLETGFADEVAYNKCIKQIKDVLPVHSYFDVRNVNLFVEHKPMYVFDTKMSIISMKLRNIILKYDDSNVYYKLYGVITGDLMLVTLTPMRNDTPVTGKCEALSLCLSMPRYIVSTSWEDATKPMSICLSKMDELSRILRAELFAKAQNNHMSLVDNGVYPGLLGLPFELYNHIFHCLSPNQLRILANVNRQFHQLVTHSRHYGRLPVLHFHPSFLSPSQSRTSEELWGDWGYWGGY